MKIVFAKLAMLMLHVVPIDVDLQEPWSFAYENIIIGNGSDSHLGSLEIIASEGCKAFELRIWARIFDTDTNLLSLDDNVKLNLTLGDAQVASRASVIHMAVDLSTNFDLVYLSLGSWDWRALEAISLSNAERFEANFVDDRANLEDNIWRVANLRQVLDTMYSNCFTQTAGHSSLTTFT